VALASALLYSTVCVWLGRTSELWSCISTAICRRSYECVELMYTLVARLSGKLTTALLFFLLQCYTTFCCRTDRHLISYFTPLIQIELFSTLIPKLPMYRSYIFVMYKPRSLALCYFTDYEVTVFKLLKDMTWIAWLLLETLPIFLRVFKTQHFQRVSSSDIYQLFQKQIRIPLPNLHLKRKTHPVSEEMPFRAPSMSVMDNVLSTSQAYFSVT
jgi:hypothetical protein